MKTVDQILLDIQHTKWEKSDLSFPTQDKRILNSFCNQLRAKKFLTENQSKLLLKIFKENKDILKLIYNEDLSFLESPSWSERFRVIEQIKRIYTTPSNTTHFFVEFSFNKRIKEVITLLIQKEKIEVLTVSNKTYGFLFTESNIYLVIKYLKSFKFEISQNLLNFYNEIDSIKKEIKNLDATFLTDNPKIHNCLLDEIGPDWQENHLLVMDRKIRYAYQYFYNFPKKTLATDIAQRKKPRVWIDSNKNGFNDIIQSLIDLKRFPVLFILDGHNVLASLENLFKIHSTLNIHQKACNVYFRLDSKSGDNFNKYISEHKLNLKLDKFSDSAIIDNGKLPKFFLNSMWYPKSVISFTNNFNNNKGTVWCDQVDLIIYYTDRQPIMADHYEIL